MQFRNPYDITPQTSSQEQKMRRDHIQFPPTLPTNIHKPIHKYDFEFNDRQFRNDRNKRSELPVQNNYLQRYQIHELQQDNFNQALENQQYINEQMRKKIPTDGNQLMRNHDDAIFFQSRTQQPDFINMAESTRRERFDLNIPNREPMSGRIVGAPIYNGFRNL